VRHADEDLAALGPGQPRHRGHRVGGPVGNFSGEWAVPETQLARDPGFPGVEVDRSAAGGAAYGVVARLPSTGDGPSALEKFLPVFLAARRQLAEAAESVPVPEVVTAARTLAALAVDVCGTVQWD
jgi:hypothetical protein